ncbi:hypothetical protein [Lysobacter terrae]
MATKLAFELAEEREPALKEALAAELRTNTADPDAERIERAYLERMRRYVKEIADAPNAGYRKPGEFPSLMLYLPLGNETIVFDAELDLRLLELYAIHGWSGVIALETAVNERRSYPPLGVPVPWAEVLSFLRATRHLLMLRIRSALIGIEVIVGGSVSARLSDSRKTLDDAIATLKIKQVEVDRGESAAHGGPATSDTPGMAKEAKIGDRELLAKIHLGFDEILRGKRVLERLRLDLKVLDAKIGVTRQAMKQKTEGRSGGVALPSEEAESQERKEIERAEDERRALARSGVDADQALKLLTQKLGALATPLLLAIPQLKDGFSIEDTERAVADTFQNMYERVDAMYAAIQSAPSAIRTYLPDSPTDLDRPGHLDKIALRPIDACAIAVAGAIETASKNPARLAMLSQEALLAALENDEIPQGSLSHIVVVHYLVDLLDGLEAQAEDEAVRAAISQGLATIGAALSLSALVASRVPTPQAQIAAGTMRLVGNALQLPTVLLFAYSTLHQLRQLDEAVSLRLLSAEFDDIDIVAQLAELDAFRRGFSEQIGSELGKMLIENIAAGQLTAVKKVILVRGYLDDLITLLPEDDDSGTTDG